MMKISISNPEALKKAIDQSAFAGGMCYQPSVEEAEKTAETLPVKSALFDTSHHTTIQHSDHTVSFIIDDIPVSLVTFGLHYTHPFYNTSQRSGRYCTKMFKNDRAEDRKNHIYNFLSNYGDEKIYDGQVLNEIVEWVESGITFFNRELPGITELAKEAIKTERPYYKGNIDLQASRIAQEQLRNVISTIVPTGLVYTINLSTLFSMYLTAWNKPMVDLLTKMVDEVVKVNPEIGKLIDSEFYKNPTTRKNYVIPTNNAPPYLCTRPIVLVDMSCCNKGNIYRQMFDNFNDINKNTCFNLLPFSPISKFQHEEMKSTLLMSTATFGQYQRHRTIERFGTEMTRNFYVPPLLRNEKTNEFIDRYNDRYWELSEKYGHSNMVHFAPYGTMINFQAVASLSAWNHSITKRVCLNAQEEFWNLERMLISCVIPSTVNQPGPPCVEGKCHEGKRYCGRDLSKSVTRNLI